MNETLTQISEADIQFFMEAFDCNRERAIELLEIERRFQIEYETYLSGKLDPRD